MTAVDGEVVVLDSGGHGRVTIDKSVAIVAPAGVLAAVGNAIASNGSVGILASGSLVTAVVSRNTITANTFAGIEQSNSAVVESDTQNIVCGNNSGAAQTWVRSRRSVEFDVEWRRRRQQSLSFALAR